MIRCPVCGGRLRRLDSYTAGAGGGQTHRVLSECRRCLKKVFLETRPVGPSRKGYLPRKV
jgi:hypothetical protein